MSEQPLRKQLILSIGGILFLIVFVLSTSYAVFTFSKAGTKENVIRSGTISFSYNETTNGISITNAQPMTDAAGKILVANDVASGVTQGYFDFNVTGAITGTIPVTYEVYGTVDTGSTMDSNFVKVYLTDGKSPEKALAGYDGATVPVYGALPVATSDTTGKRLFTGTFSTGNLSQTFRLRIWVADSYTVADVSKTFTMRVNVKATA